MKFNYKLHRLCGASYGNPSSTQTTAAASSGGANVIYDSTGNVLLSPVSNRVQIIDLQTHTASTLPIEARSNIQAIALSPDDRLLLIVDVNNYAILANYRRGVVLHRFRFKRRVRCIQFSPNGLYFAVSFGKHVQVWRCPGLRRRLAPFVLHRTYTGLSGDVVDITFSDDSTVLMACSRDSTARIWTLDTVKDFVPSTLSGHKGSLVGGYFEQPTAKNNRRLTRCFTVSSDGALVTWKCNYPSGDDPRGDKRSDFQAQSNAAVDFFSGGAAGTSMGGSSAFGMGKDDATSSASKRKKLSQAHQLVGATWDVEARHYFQQDNSSVTATSHSAKHNLLVVGFSTGLFGLYELPSVSNVHTLSISNQYIRTVSINNTGEWLAFGCPSNQQLLVWEWRSETYVIKQRGHAYGMRCMSYSPDGIVVATGGEDGSLKLWNSTSGFCYCTLTSHTAPITATTFAGSSVVLTASLDGTVRAHDLHRYKNFRTLTSPTPVQFVSLAIDPAGEIVAAGTADPFNVYVWNLQNSRLLDILSGHAGPVCTLAFNPLRGTLASASWDGTVKLWDLYKRETEPESIQHSSDVVCLAFRPDGKAICTGTIGGLLSFWNVEDCSLMCEIDGRRDIAGGRKMNDRMTSDNNASSRYFTSVCYSADGSCVLAGGNSKYVCIYEVSQQILLKKFQISFNRSLDGVLDELNSKNLGEGGPLDDMNESGDEADFSSLIPGAKRGDDGSRKSRVEVMSLQVAFSSTGREWATVSNEGLHVYSLDDDATFDPVALDEAVTPGAVQSNLLRGDYGKALRMSLYLNEYALVKQVIEETPYQSISHVVRSVGTRNLERLLQYVAKSMSDSPHVEFYLKWCLELLQNHGAELEKNKGSYMRAFRAMHKMVQTRYDEVEGMCAENRYAMDFVEDQAKLNL